ncbi:hypothetical protein TNIN_135011 [Trichonephila inaurata madagascariensis]|uniref:Uncharacterized protein n=1 Tax=Trichonephila inaurata madagascariensis TaxID=2747483 RepID=A0A8X6XY38_9ARAC|nr:hypothetical protein TNIN_135011 [Trichonephila inaurata madagascariensis]
MRHLFVESYKTSPVLHVQDSPIPKSVLVRKCIQDFIQKVKDIRRIQHGSSLRMVYEAFLRAGADIRPSAELAERLAQPERIPTLPAQRLAEPERICTLPAEPERCLQLSSESGERRGETGKKTSLAGNQGGRRDQPVNKRKRSSGSKESLIGLKQQKYKKTRQEVTEYKRRIPASRSALAERKKSRKPGRETQKRVLTPSSTSIKPVQKTIRESKENFGQVPTEDLRPSPEESLQSSQIQQGRSSPYNLRRRSDVTKELDYSTIGT